MHTLRLIHRWIGLVVALPIVLVALSGGLLVFRDPYYRVRWPVVAQDATAAEFAIQPRILQHIESHFGDSLRSVKFPRPGVNAFHVYLLHEREGLVAPRTGDVIATWHWREDPAAFMFQLHAHLLMGAQGELLNGYLAVVLLFISLSGIVLWFPRRRSAFRLRQALPAGLSSAALLKSHAASGIWLLPVIALFASTGAGLVFYEQVGAVSAALMDRAPAQVPNAFVAPNTTPHADWTRLLTAARTALPESGPTMCYVGRGENVVFTCRKSLPGEWHPNGRSYVLIDPYTADILQTIDARQQGAGTRLIHALYPLHAAKVGGFPLALLAVLTGFGLAWLAIGGSWTYVRRVLAQPTRSGPTGENTLGGVESALGQTRTSGRLRDSQRQPMWLLARVAEIGISAMVLFGCASRGRCAELTSAVHGSRLPGRESNRRTNARSRLRSWRRRSTH